MIPMEIREADQFPLFNRVIAIEMKSNYFYFKIKKIKKLHHS